MLNLPLPAILGLWSCTSRAGPLDRRMEALDRGVGAAVQEDGSVFVSWRVLATDVEEVALNVYRSGRDGETARLDAGPLLGSTWLVDTGAGRIRPTTYEVRPVVEDVEQPANGEFTVSANAPVGPYVTIPVDTPEGCHPNDASVGDLDGDRHYEIVVHMVGIGGDVMPDGVRTEPVFDAYKLDGTRLWRINLGRNIREGSHYTPFIVYELDGSGTAEVACRTADGTWDGAGAAIGDPEADWRNERGVVLRGPEFLTVFDGPAGRALQTVPYVPPRHPTNPLDPTPQEYKAAWGDDYGNRGERCLACVACLDGERPSLIMCRGYYTRTVLAAWDWREGQLGLPWVFDTAAAPGIEACAGEGNHQVSVADVDSDGRDEIIYGSCTIDDNGKGLYSTGLGHGDALHVANFDPDRPGLEVWQCHESGGNGATFRDARSGEIIFQDPATKDMGRACAGDITAEYRRAELWGSAGCLLYSCRGQEIGPSPRQMNFVIWWDGDLLRELLDGTTISKYGQGAILEAEECTSNNSTKSTPCLQADIIGDWREEVLWRTVDNRALRLYTTNVPAEYRLPTLMHDPQYRLAVAWQNAGYNQPPHPGFFLGDGMRWPPTRPAAPAP